MTAPRFATAAQVARSPAFDPDATPPFRFKAGPPFEALDLRPGRVVLIGAPPAAGKTALALQVVAGVLRHEPAVKAVVANVEMSAADLLARVASRLAGVPVGQIVDKTLSVGDKVRLKVALENSGPLLERLAFLDPPFTLGHLAAAADAFGATLLVVDYVQRFGAGGDQREALDGLMTRVRALALAGAAVLLVSSVSRQRTDKGASSYAGLTMASFRGSAELEFGADAAYLLDAAGGAATLRCVKNRYGVPADVPLRFRGEYQRFDPGDPLDGFDSAPADGPKRGRP